MTKKATSQKKVALTLTVTVYETGPQEFEARTSFDLNEPYFNLDPKKRRRLLLLAKADLVRAEMGADEP